MRAPEDENLNETKLRKRSEKCRDEHSGRCLCGLFCMCLTSQTDVSDELSGDFHVVLHEKSCILPSLCGVVGEKYIMGLNFTFANECCNTHLCNGATPATHYWTITLLTPLILYSVWNQKMYILVLLSLMVFHQQDCEKVNKIFYVVLKWFLMLQHCRHWLTVLYFLSVLKEPAFKKRRNTTKKGTQYTAEVSAKKANAFSCIHATRYETVSFQWWRVYY